MQKEENSMLEEAMNAIKEEILYDLAELVSVQIRSDDSLKMTNNH